MSNLTRFMKQNKIIKENTTFAATKSLTDEDGQPLLWEIKPISTKEDEKIRDACTIEVPIKGKSNLYRPKINTSKYICKLVVAAVAFPDLMNAELQDSYGVKTPEELLTEMINDPGEYNEFVSFVQRLNGFDISLDEKIDQAKN